jgi:predicted transcriptional regulator
VNIQTNGLLRAQQGIEPFGLPPEVLQLFPREREIAILVYTQGLATAKDIEAALGGTLSNAAIRSMLTRLTHKGIIVPQRCGRRRKFVYAAALSETFAREMALKQFAQDFYRGSLSLLADDIADLFAASPVAKESTGRDPEILPAEVQDLFPRMREIATIVYMNGGVTVREVQERLSDSLTVYGIRTLLGRLAGRGIVKRRRSGRHSELIYLPGITTKDIRRIGLMKFIDQRFGGSAAIALQVVLQVMRAEPKRPARRARQSIAHAEVRAS